jgi:signal transduction histidine kinase
MVDVALVLGLATLGVGLAAALLIHLLPTLRLQLAVLALVSAVLPLAAVFATGLVMYHMHDDVKILAVSSASALAAVVGALLLARLIANALERLNRASARVARGDLTARAPERGPRELASLGRSFNQMTESVEELFDARRQLVAWASHDLRTPLASITAMLEALDDGLAEPDEYVPVLRDRVRALSSVVDDLFELARIDAGALTVELRDAPLGPVVTDCVRGFEAQANARHVHLETRVADPLPAARCAPEKVERVLFNLLTNALRHTPSDGSIAVLVTAADGTVEVAVEDTGDGLEPVAERRMFERFWRGDPSRGSDGAGLGLAIAQGLIEAQGGRIWAENRPDGGARVAFVLPSAA